MEMEPSSCRWRPVDRGSMRVLLRGPSPGLPPDPLFSSHCADISLFLTIIPYTWRSKSGLSSLFGIVILPLATMGRHPEDDRSCLAALRPCSALYGTLADV